MESIELDVGGETFAAYEHGPSRGPLALFLHGFPDLPTSWEPVMRRFARAGYRAVAPFLRGYPPSTTAGPFGLDRLARDALGIGRELSPRRPFFLVGHDWGAAIAWFVAMKAPARLAAATTMSAPHPAAFARALLRDPRQLWRSRYMLAFQVRGTDRAHVGELWRRWSPQLVPPAEHLDVVAGCIAEADGAPVRYYRSTARPSRLEWLRYVDRDRATVRAPMLYLHGLDDECVAYAAARGQDALVEAPYRMELIAGAGHFLQLEKPGAVADKALRFFETYGPTRPNRMGVTT